MTTEPDDDFDPSEREFLQNAGKPKSFSYYFGAWKSGVEEVEEGYKLEIEGYRTILLWRTIFENHRSEGPSALRRRLDLALPEIDARFRAATWPIGESLVNRKRAPEDMEKYWWEYRLPNTILPYLMEDLRPWFDDRLRERGYI